MQIPYRFLWIFSIALLGCGDDYLPKPKAMLRLAYSEARYVPYLEADHYRFKKNTIAAVVRQDKGDALHLNYPNMKATLFITHTKIDNNLDRLLSDAQKLTYEHVIKADAITEYPFINPSNIVYGMLYEISGNAASQLQFYATDSTQNFLTGALYFYAKPNYDSIFPAAAYLKKDIERFMESLQWKE